MRFLFLLLFLPFLTVAQKNDWVWSSIGFNENFIPLTTKKQVTIAVIDDAFDLNNFAIKPYLYNNKREIANNIDDDKNGKTDDLTGWDISDNDSDVNPPSHALNAFSHGTKVTGILIQTIQKLTKDAGFVKILPIKTSSDLKQINYITSGYEGIKYALEQKADIIVCSWSGGSFSPEQELILKQAEKQGALVIASAGNFVSEVAQMPGAFHWSINVTSVNKENKKLPAANYGNFVDIAAPGDSIFTTAPKLSDYSATLSATSASVPIIAGIIASFASAYPQIKLEEWDRILKNSAVSLDKENPFYVGKLGAGIPNINTIKKIIEGENITSFNNIKGYVNLKDDTFVKLTFKAPSVKIEQATYHKKGEKVKIKSWNNGTPKDSLLQLTAPYFFMADSFLVGKSTKKDKWIYYETQAVDSSSLYCSGIVELSGKEGVIEDGSKEATYSGRSDCKWKIEVSKGKRIKIWFEEFDTEAKIDQIYIFNGHGTEAPILAIFSGPKIPPQVTTWENKALIWFLSDESTNHKGWKLKWEEVD